LPVSCVPYAGVAAGRSGVVAVTANAAGFTLIEKYTPVRWMLPG